VGARVRLGLTYTGDAVSVSVVDDGGGGRVETEPSVRPAPQSATAGHGLIGMRERVNVHGGELSAGPSGTGWAVAATIPVRVAAVAT
jgi:signal transduction histidine kinase